MARITAEQVTREPWKYTVGQYQAALGVYQPHIAEISPMQYAHLSKRGKRQYDTKRTQEWDASANAKRAWRAAVIAAHDADAFNQHDPSTSDEAREAIRYEERRRREAVTAFRLEEALHRNKIASVDELSVGDRVFSIMAGQYGTVTKKHKVSVNVHFPDHAFRQDWKCNVGELQRLSYNDAKAQATA